MKPNRILLLALLLLPTAAAATTVRLLTEAEMARHAAAVVRGTVVSVTPRWDGRLIVTDVTIRVERLLKADQSSELVSFTQLGGTLDGATLHVPGTSRYTEGEQVIVFLEAGGRGLVEIGVGAGKYRVSVEDGRRVVARELAGLGFARVEGRTAVPAAPPPMTEPEPLEAFESRILRALSGE